MEHVAYRELETTDFAQLEKLLRETWDFSKYTRDKALVDAKYTEYLCAGLEASTHGEVAVLGDEVVGFLLGAIDGEPPLAGAEKNHEVLLKARHEISRLGGGGGRGGESTSTSARPNIWAQAEEYYKEVLASIPSKGHIELFIVGKKSQGHGVGKQLLQHFEEKFYRESGGIFYVQTDSMCNYHFYDAQGFTLRGSKTLTHADGSPIDLFLYTK